MSDKQNPINFHEMSVETARRAIVAAFREAQIETADLDARLLLQAAMGCDATALARAPEAPISEAQAEILNDYIAQRLRHKPVSRIMGQREFYGRDFKINERVLDPRPDSETLIDEVLSLTDDTPIRLLDLGTGSGCLLISLLAEREDWTGLGADVSPQALDVARANADALGVAARAEFVESDWFKNIARRFDVIISNPPYLGPGEMEWLARDVMDYDPHLALYGGSDGLDPYRLITAQSADYLADDGFLVFEIGALQGRAVSALMVEAGFAQVKITQDLAGRDRVVSGRFSGGAKK